MMKYWENIVNNTPNSPNEYYRELNNQYLADQWKNTILKDNVEEEICVGSFKFKKIDAWVQTVTQFTNNIIKDADDFRQILFKCSPYTNERGQYYKYNDNYWITYETSDKITAYSSSLIRRCNNIIKWFDTDSGMIYEYPCVLEYNISSTNIRYDKDINVANSSITLVLQGNENTYKLRRNDRFIINGIPYKYVAVNNFMNVPTTDGKPTLLFIDLDFDLEKPEDDILNNIANIKAYNYEINIGGNPNYQVSGFNGTLSADVVLNGEETDKEVKWSSNKFATVDEDGNYELIGAIGKIAKITASFGVFSKTVEIEIVDFSSLTKEVVISPLIEELKERESVDFDVALYVGGIRQNLIPIINTSGASVRCYILSQNGNSVTLTNLHKSNDLLNINFTFSNISKEINIKLGALY